MKLMFDGERAFRHVEVLAGEIGPREGGSDAEARAAEYIADQFKTLGLETEV